MRVTVETDMQTALKLTNSKTLKGDLLKAKIQSQVYYVNELIKSHFQRISPNTYYKPNKPSYETWKRKHFTSLYQLVSTGRLRNAMLNGRVNSSTGKITFNIPEYGIYQIEAGRDFLNPSRDDQIQMQIKLRQELFEIRSKRAKAFAK